MHQKAEQLGYIITLSANWSLNTNWYALAVRFWTSKNDNNPPEYDRRMVLFTHLAIECMLKQTIYKNLPKLRPKGTKIQSSKHFLIVYWRISLPPSGPPTLFKIPRWRSSCGRSDLQAPAWISENSSPNIWILHSQNNRFCHKCIFVCIFVIFNTKNVVLHFLLHWLVSW